MREATPFIHSDELAVDHLTSLGAFPLLFTGLLHAPDIESPSIVSARLLQGKKVVLAHTLCEQKAMLATLLAFLRQRSVYWPSVFDLWCWAVAHHWPHSDDIKPADSTWKCDCYPAPSTRSMTADEKDLRLAITERGRYAYDYCFSIDQLVVAWDPDRDQFGFPEILDFMVLQRCIKLLAASNAAFFVSGFWVETTPQPSLHSFHDLKRLGEMRNWSHLHAFLDRLAFWEDVRAYLISGSDGR
jgi:hypothetical protein